MLEHQMYVDQVETPLYAFENTYVVQTNRISVMQTIDCYNNHLISHLTVGSYIDSYLYFMCFTWISVLNVRWTYRFKKYKNGFLKCDIRYFFCLRVTS